MKPTDWGRTFDDVFKNGQRIRELKNQQRRAEAGICAWTDDDAEELRVLVRGQTETMAAMARDVVVKRLDNYRRPACPERPASLGLLDDERLAKDLLAARKRMNEPPPRKKEDSEALRAARQIMNRWAEHVRAVQKVEREGATRALQLLRAWSHARAVGDRHTADVLRGFLGREWGHRGPLPEDIDAAALRLARRRDVISDEMMHCLGCDRSSCEQCSVKRTGERVEKRDGPQQLTAPELV